MPLCPSLPRLLAVAGPCALALSVNACAPVGEADEEISVFGQPIKGGYASPDDAAVVAIYDASIGAECSGSLLAPNVVLTARHCVSSTPDSISCGSAAPGPLHAASDFYVTTKPYLTQDASDYHTVREVVALPLDPNSSDPLLKKEDLCGRDMAILILDGNVDPSEAAPLVPRVDSSLVEGEEYDAIGFGATDDQGSGAGVRRRRDHLFVECVADECPSVYVKTSEFIGDTGICHGDSGGPAVDKQNRVVGVTSRGGFGCTNPVYGHVLGWGQWIKDTVLYASQASIGNYAPPGWANGLSTDPGFHGPVGGACDAAECTAKYCIHTGTDLGEYCTRRCDAVNTCPDGFECHVDLGLCADQPDPKPIDDGKGEDPDEASSEEGGCSVASLDPTKPIPWKTGAMLGFAVGALALRRRRRS